MATGGSSFISKPARGWLHPDHLVSKEGITYTVKVSFYFFIIIIQTNYRYLIIMFYDFQYIGCLEVYTSMKSLDFETRSCVAK